MPSGRTNPLKHLAIAFVLLVLTAFARAEPPSDPAHCAPDGVAVGGFDLVSYHQDGGPVPGSADHALELEDLTYRFKSRENLETFRQSTERYLPVYRGWCAATLAMGRLACPDYSNYKIEEGRLLLFEVTGFTNGRTLWNSDPLGFRERADLNFQRLVK